MTQCFQPLLSCLSFQVSRGANYPTLKRQGWKAFALKCVPNIDEWVATLIQRPPLTKPSFVSGQRRLKVTKGRFFHQYIAGTHLSGLSLDLDQNNLEQVEVFSGWPQMTSLTVAIYRWPMIPINDQFILIILLIGLIKWLINDLMESCLAPSTAQLSELLATLLFPKSCRLTPHQGRWPQKGPLLRSTKEYYLL